MNRKRKPYNTYPREFKLEAVRLMQAGERPTTEIAAELGIPRNRLYKWQAQLEAKGDKAFPRQARAAKKGRQE